MAPSPARHAPVGRLAGTAVMAAALLAGMPGVASAAPNAVQPKPGTIYTGGTANGGKVTLELKRTWNSTTERVYMAPFITWTKVKATCDIFNGTEFVPTPKRITARLQITRWEGRVRKGRFSQTEFYNGAPVDLQRAVHQACGDRHGAQDHHLRGRQRPWIRLQLGPADLRPRGQLSPLVLVVNAIGPEEHVVCTPPVFCSPRTADPVADWPNNACGAAGLDLVRTARCWAPRPDGVIPQWAASR
ncbi:MAG: hypothetical protein IPG68_06000 [Micrococcales bacterium]|nr:hypothetical protein [Micrococcales bacterium]